MEQFVVPQFIDNEDKIMGPLTGRQFIIVLVMFMILAAMFKLMPIVWFAVTGIPLFAFGIILAFSKVNGQPFHLFALNVTQTLKKPRLRVWDKRLNDAEVRAHLLKEIPPPTPPRGRKTFANASRLQELTLVVNTGGVYKPEE